MNTAWKQHATQLSQVVLERFVNRLDSYGAYWPLSQRNGHSKSYTAKDRISAEVLQDHFCGTTEGGVIGLHSTSSDGQCRWICIDIDQHDEDSSRGEANERYAINKWNQLASQGIASALEDSNGNGGFHLWVLAKEAVPSETAWRFAQWLIRDWQGCGVDHPETFPKQPTLAANGYGNWVRLPGRHHTRDHWSRFWNGHEWIDGPELFLQLQPNDTATIEAKAIHVQIPKPKEFHALDEATPEDIQSALAAIPAGELHHDEWVSVGMALQSAGQSCDVWDAWSAGDGDRYKPGECEKRWKSFSESGGVGVGTLFSLALKRGWRFPEKHDPAAEQIDISAIIRNGTRKRHKRTTASIEEIPSRFLNVPGFIGEFTQYTLDAAHRPNPTLALMGAISTQSYLAGRRVKDASGNRTNLYCVGIAPSGSGKGNVIHAVKSLLSELRCGTEGEMCPMLTGLMEEAGSDSGMIVHMAEHPNTLAQVDEIGRFLGSANDRKNQHIYNVISAWLKMYGAEGLTYVGKKFADKKKSIQIVNPCLTIQGYSTFDGFYAGLDSGFLEGGMASRMLIFQSEICPEHSRKRSMPLPDRVVEHARIWAMKSQGQGNLGGFIDSDPVVVPTDEAAEAVFDAFVDKTENGCALPREIVSRTAQNAMRLAMTYACSENAIEPRITAQAAQWGCELVWHLAVQLSSACGLFMSENLIEKHTKRVLGIIRQAGEAGIARNELTHKTLWLKRHDRESILDSLTESESIDLVRLETAGRPKAVYTYRERNLNVSS
tara:strand:+ start:844 stop:3165 length:2322 start_codon:yes stop_codon:yes gene_type:complete